MSDKDQKIAELQTVIDDVRARVHEYVRLLEGFEARGVDIEANRGLAEGMYEVSKALYAALAGTPELKRQFASARMLANRLAGLHGFPEVTA